MVYIVVWTMDDHLLCLGSRNEHRSDGVFFCTIPPHQRLIIPSVVPSWLPSIREHPTPLK